MAPAPARNGGYGVAVLPQNMNFAGTYIIVNTNSNNRYIGISGDIANRFRTRLATVTEMGFTQVEMGNIGVTWGQTAYRNTNQANANWNVVNPAPPAAYSVIIDGANVNLEYLLIGFVITQLGAGGTVSNNVMAAAPYINPTQNPIDVLLTWGDMGGLFRADEHLSVWGVGDAW